MLWLIPLILIIAAVIYYNWLAAHLFKPSPQYPDVAKIDSSKKLVVCAGDSITHGNMSANYVEILTEKYPDYQFFNAGINADLSYTLRNRMDDIIAVQPEIVTLLIGCNDVNANMNPKRLKEYYAMKKVTEKPTIQGYEENLTHIIQRLKAETKAQIAILSLTVMSENLLHSVNHQADRYNEIVKKVAEKQGVMYLPLREKMKDFLKKSPTTNGTIYEKTSLLIRLALLKFHVLGKNWDVIATDNGNQIVTDNLHLNTVGAEMIAELIGEKMLE